jgi:voltage-gated potassium channel
MKITREYRLFYGLAVLLWIVYVTEYGGSDIHRIWTFVAGIVSVAAVAYLSTMVIVSRASNADIISALIGGASLIISNFAAIYWTYGSLGNFNEHLSKVAALYFTLGTFTTAGTGTISPVSDFARAIVSCQYVVDLFFVAWIIAIGVSRIGVHDGSP